MVLYLELQCHSLNRGAAATPETVFKSLFLLLWGREQGSWCLTTVFWVSNCSLSNSLLLFCHWLIDSTGIMCGGEDVMSNYWVRRRIRQGEGPL